MRPKSLKQGIYREFLPAGAYFWSKSSYKPGKIRMLRANSLLNGTGNFA
jgi:hypothetical protein